ncbi:MAG TPA: hypothetical protein VIJ16_08790 [Gemmatimonadaceae bacterium]
MTKRNDATSRGAGRVGEPVQVYLDAPDRERLERLAAQLDATKSDVLRRGLETLESATRRERKKAPPVEPLPTYRGRGLRPGVDLDDMSSLIDLMNERDAAR